MTVIRAADQVLDHGHGPEAGRFRVLTGAAPTVARAGERLHVLHTGSRPPLWLTRLADRLRPVRPSEAVILVGTVCGGEDAEGLYRLLSPALEESRDARVRLLTLVMSEGANETTGRPSAARLICERYGFDVLAAAGPALVTAEGSLFSPGPAGTVGGWWHLSPGAAARRVSNHLPVPDWEPAVWRVGRQAVAGHVVEPVPAGLAVRPLGPVSPAVHARMRAVPPERGRPQLILMTPDVPTAVLAVVMGSLPDDVRRALRLVSLAGGPIPRTAQEVADLLGCEVQTAVGTPLVSGGPLPDGASAGDAAADQYLLDANGRPTWRPFARTIVHTPATDRDGGTARVTQWRVPPVLRGGAGADALPLGRHWRAAVTAAGLWIGPRDAEPPFLVTARPARADTVALDLGVPHRALGDALWDALWPQLDTLLGQMDSEMCVRTVVRCHGDPGVPGRERLLELTVRHGLRHAGLEEPDHPASVGRHSTARSSAPATTER